MGWDHSSHWSDKDDVVHYLKNAYKNAVIHHQTYEGGQHILWSVLCKPNDIANKEELLIVCDLIGYSTNGWGHKTMNEMMGPFYYSCPIHFLNLTDESKYKNEGWRNKVTEYHNVKLTG
jgi:hypothetical protein